MKRTGFKRPERPERQPIVLTPVPPEHRRRAVMTQVSAQATQVPKDAPHRSEAWRRAVASLPCVRCGREGMTQAAHRNFGKGMGTKADDCMTAALCAPCHSEIDQGNTMTRDERRAALDCAILDTIRQLVRHGMLGPPKTSPG